MIKQSNERNLKVRDFTSPILYVFSFRLIRATKDAFVKTDLVCTPNPTLLNTQSLLPFPLHSDISFSPSLCPLSVRIRTP